MTETRIGLVGCGRWGRLILRDLVALGCDVPVVARSAESVSRAHEHGASAIVESVDALPELDGVVVCVPTTRHAEVIESLFDRDIPIYTEKPLTADASSARRIVELAGDRVFVMDKWRYHDGIMALASIARSGELGAPVGLRTTRVGWHTRPLDVDETWHLAPHDLSIALEILGELPEARAAVFERAGASVVGMHGLLQTEGKPWVSVEVSARRPNAIREVRLICERGVAVLPDSYSEHIEVYPVGEPDGAEAQVERRPISTEFPLLRELRAFVEHVRGGPPPKSSAAEAAGTVEAIAALRSLGGLK